MTRLYKVLTDKQANNWANKLNKCVSEIEMLNKCMEKFSTLALGIQMTAPLRHYHTQLRKSTISKTKAVYSGDELWVDLLALEFCQP